MDGTDIYREWAPPAAWRAAVACRWEQRVNAGRRHRVVPDGCADVVQSLENLRKQSSRIVVTPDPNLPGKVAAVVWGWSWTGDAFDASAVACVRKHQDEEAPEPGLACAQ